MVIQIVKSFPTRMMYVVHAFEDKRPTLTDNIRHAKQYSGNTTSNRDLNWIKAFNYSTARVQT